MPTINNNVEESSETNIINSSWVKYIDLQDMWHTWHVTYWRDKSIGFLFTAIDFVYNGIEKM